jgi:uncharacterized protein (TIGR02588 family)
MNQRLATKMRPGDTPRLEWLLGALGLALLAAAVSYLTYQGLSNPSKPGAVVVTVLDVRAVGGAHVVKFSVRNEGDENLSHLHLVARLSDGDREIEAAPAFIDYLPARSEQRGGVYLKHDPRRHTLRIDPAGYMEP